MRLRADSVIWLAVAALLFVLSAVLTAWITHVTRNPTPDGIEFGFTATTENPPADIRVPSVMLSVLSDTALQLDIIHIDPGHIATVRFGPFLNGSERNLACVEPVDTLSGTGPTVPVTTAFEPAAKAATERLRAPAGAHPVFAVVSVAQLPSRRGYGWVRCVLPSFVVHDTFTSRSINIAVRSSTDVFADANDELTPESDRAVEPYRIAFDDADADEMRISDTDSGEMRFATNYVVPKHPDDGTARGTHLRYTWNSLTADQHRDIYIVIIGSLIALAAAAVIEAVRPSVEALVAARETSEEP